MKKRLLYLSCHEILEANEVSLFNELGYEVFSPGAYVCNENRGDQCLRPSIPNYVVNPDIRAQYDKIGAAHPGKDGKDYLTEDFVKDFDIIF